MTVLKRMSAVLVLVAACHGGAAFAQDPLDAELDAMIAANESDEAALALARRQADAGNLTGAAATLERSLLLRSSPQSDDVRLYYASVLCRLGDDRRGAYQLANVRNAAAEGWAEARAACGQLPLATSAVRGDGVSAMLTLGVSYDSDALGALTPQFEVIGFPTATEEGASVVASGIVNGQFASRVTGHGYAGASLISRNDISGPDVDYQTAALWGGYARHLGGDDRQLAGGPIVRHSRLLGDGLLTEYGLQADYSFSGGGPGRWTIRGEAVRQDFLGSGFASVRDGEHYEVGVTYRNSPELPRVWTAGVVAEVKTAELDSFAYRGGRAFVAAQMPIGDNGAYLTGSGVARYVDFDDSGLGSFGSEARFYLRAAAGIPLNRQGLFAEAGVTYSSRRYDDTSLYSDFDSVGVEARLVYRFGL